MIRPAGKLPQGADKQLLNSVRGRYLRTVDQLWMTGQAPDGGQLQIVT
jgi:hypothetical protein